MSAHRRSRWSSLRRGASRRKYQPDSTGGGGSYHGDGRRSGGTSPPLAPPLTVDAHTHRHLRSPRAPVSKATRTRATQQHGGLSRRRHHHHHHHHNSKHNPLHHHHRRLPLAALRTLPPDRSEKDVEAIWNWLAKHPIREELLGSITVFSDAAQALCQSVRLVRIPAGSVLFEQGSAGNMAYLLLAGTCDIRYTQTKMQAFVHHDDHHDDGGRHTWQADGGDNLDRALGSILMHVTEGAVIGDSAALVCDHMTTTPAAAGAAAAAAAAVAAATSLTKRRRQPRRPCSVVATSDCDLLAISHDVFKTCMESTSQTMELQELVMAFSEMLVFRDFTPVELTFLAKWTTQQEYRCDDFIYAAGSDVTSIHFLLRGEVRLTTSNHHHTTTSASRTPITVEHFTPPCIFGDHAVVKAAASTARRGPAARASRSKRKAAAAAAAVAAAAAARTGAPGVGAAGAGRASSDSPPPPSITQRAITACHAFSATAASHCIVASVPVQVFAQIVLQHGAKGPGGLLAALDAGGFVPPLAVLSRFANDRERWLRQVASDTTPRDEVDFIRCFKCGQRGHAAALCGKHVGASKPGNRSKNKRRKSRNGRHGHRRPQDRRNSRRRRPHQNPHSHSRRRHSHRNGAAATAALRRSASRARSAASSTKSRAASAASLDSLTITGMSDGSSFASRASSSMSGTTRSRHSQRRHHAPVQRHRSSASSLSSVTPHQRRRQQHSATSSSSAGRRKARKSNGSGSDLMALLLPGRRKLANGGASSDVTGSSLADNMSDIRRRKLADREHDALAAALTLLNAADAPAAKPVPPPRTASRRQNPAAAAGVTTETITRMPSKAAGRRHSSSTGDGANGAAPTSTTAGLDDIMVGAGSSAFTESSQSSFTKQKRRSSTHRSSTTRSSATPPRRARDVDGSSSSDVLSGSITRRKQTHGHMGSGTAGRARQLARQHGRSTAKESRTYSPITTTAILRPRRPAVTAHPKMGFASLTASPVPTPPSTRKPTGAGGSGLTTSLYTSRRLLRAKATAQRPPSSPIVALRGVAAAPSGAAVARVADTASPRHSPSPRTRRLRVASSSTRSRLRQDTSPRHLSPLQSIAL